MNFAKYLCCNCEILRELAPPAHKIRMDMCLGRRCDAEPILRGQFSMAVDVAFGINDQSLSGMLGSPRDKRIGQDGDRRFVEEHTEGSLILFCRGAARANAGAAAIIPGHSGDQHRHAAGIRNACKTRPAPTKPVRAIQARLTK